MPYKEKTLTQNLIKKFKYNPFIKSLAKPLAGLVVQHLLITKNNTESIWENSILVPVPMQRTKQKSKGFNQSQELAKQIGHAINVPAVFDNLIKVKKTKPQARLSAKERQENLKGAFSVKKPGLFAKKKIFLVDDVYTTGATMEECAKTLKKAGAKQIWGIAVAREE